MARKNGSNGTTGEWTKLDEQMNAADMRREAACGPAYTAERALNYVCEYLIKYIHGEPDHSPDVGDPGTWEDYEQAIRHAAALVAQGMEHAKAASAAEGEFERLEELRDELGMPPEEREKMESFRRERSARHAHWEREAKRRQRKEARGAAKS